uniref:Uncharacterized protein n=1 Tax=Opuntia streptacantha TaxID=393608 RepID=A0A7C9ATR0_OPUST
MPPCPGIRDPESFTPASRLITDSTRSPKKDPKKFRNPKAITLSRDLGQQRILNSTIEVPMQLANPKTAPSNVFLGLILVSGVRPNALPPRKAYVSAAIMLPTVSKVATSPTVQ